ncbi:tetratricopeptide repeat protein, partial [Magnetococcales bacterium HHB-1]
MRIKRANGWLFFWIILFHHTTGWANEGQLGLERLAQWSINYGNYMLDEGKYADALEAFDNAFEVSQREKMRAKALFHRATTLSLFLDAPQEALQSYRNIQQQFPAFSEKAYYQEGLLLNTLGRHKEAVQTLKRYQQRFPNGKFVFQSEVIVEDANRTIIRKQQQSPPSQQKRPQALPPAKEGVITIAQQQRPKIRVQLYSRAKRIQVWGDGLKL